MLAGNVGAGFLGALLAGFVAGYLVQGIKKYVKVPRSMQGLMPILIIPVLSTLAMALIMVFILGEPVKAINDAMNSGLQSLSGSSAVILGLVLGIMMAAVMGGPINKAAYLFGTATLATNQPSAIMAAVMVAGMVPPLGIALATVIAKKKFTAEEIEGGKANWVMGISFITEGAIPFAAADPLRVMPSLMAGSGIAGALSMLFNAKIVVPHGGIFVLGIPNVGVNIAMYAVAMIIGTVVTAGLLAVLKKDV
jgi:PTS system fructose-specific IIC component